VKWIRSILARLKRWANDGGPVPRPRPGPPPACCRLSAHTQGGAVVVFVANSAGESVKIRLSPAQADGLARQLRAAILAVAVLPPVEAA